MTNEQKEQELLNICFEQGYNLLKHLTMVNMYLVTHQQHQKVAGTITYCLDNIKTELGLD
jgi:hypothetical protein